MNFRKCPGFHLRWEVLRADGERELYTTRSETGGNYEVYMDRGLEIMGYCLEYDPDVCVDYVRITPTDMRYDKAQLTGILDLPQCFGGPIFSDTTTLNIQGHYNL